MPVKPRDCQQFTPSIPQYIVREVTSWSAIKAGKIFEVESNIRFFTIGTCFFAETICDQSEYFLQYGNIVVVVGVPWRIDPVVLAGFVVDAVSSHVGSACRLFDARRSIVH